MPSPALLLALTVPASFAQAVTARAAALHVTVQDWWADDLDGDGRPERIAALCNDDIGLYIVQRGDEMIELAREIDGRNRCQPPEQSPPSWHVEKRGYLGVFFAYHRGFSEDRIAWRAALPVIVWSQSHDTECRGENECTETIRETSWDRLEFNDDDKGKSRGGRIVPLEVGRPGPSRAVEVAPGVKVSATRPDVDSAPTLHLSAATPLKLAFCPDGTCGKPVTVKPSGGAAEVPVPAALKLPQFVDGDNLVIVFDVGGKRVRAQVRSVDAGGYPAAAPFKRE
jgi:hypothetical protein